jgi:predicted O-methyltransferase YrrM
MTSAIQEVNTKWSFPREIVRDEDLLGGDPGSYLTFEQLAQIYQAKYETARHFLKGQQRSVLELGVRAGYSAEVFLAAGAYKYVGIDAEQEVFWGRKGIVRPAMERIARRYPDRLINYILRSSHETEAVKWATHAAAAGFDLIHFDGDQTERGLLQDLHTYTPLLKAHGVLIIDAPCRSSGTYAAVTEFLRPGNWAHQRGLTLLPEVQYDRDFIIWRVSRERRD